MVAALGVWLGDNCFLSCFTPATLDASVVCGTLETKFTSSPMDGCGLAHGSFLASFGHAQAEPTPWEEERGLMMADGQGFVRFD